MIRSLYISVVVLLMISCNNEVTQQLDSKNPALGKLNQIIVVADEDIWVGSVGDTFRYYFESAYPILPSPEPLFDVKHYTPEELEQSAVRKELRTYAFLADLSDEESPTSKLIKKDMGTEKYNSALKYGKPFSSLGKNKWAKGQLLMYMFGPNQDSLKSSIKKSFPTLARRINEHDLGKLKAMSFGIKANKGLTRLVSEKFNVDVEIPVEYQTAKYDTINNVLWLRRGSKEADYHMVFEKLNYDNPKQLDKDSIIALRNKFGKSYVTSDVPDNYMVVNDEDLPVYEYVTDIDGHYTKEIRGVWEMTEEFTGGPFVTYVIINESRKELIYIDTFLLAPGSKKRNHMMQLDCIV
ncbi:DUF4837 family protein, partial [Saprospiraceae bacterium]|nr:DUF4837 family protein [Saprospiraceae bacterium]